MNTPEIQQQLREIYASYHRAQTAIGTEDLAGLKLCMEKVAGAARAVILATSTLERAEVIKNLEEAGLIEPGCSMCQAFYDHPAAAPMMPHHKASPRCESGKNPHCSCDVCF